MTRWRERLEAIGLSSASATSAATAFGRVVAALPPGDGAAEAWWVPGRIEVLGKHTDYGGGRSLLCAVERGFHVVARPRPDARVRMIDVESGETIDVPLSANATPRPGTWGDYPVSVVRRIARDTGASTGADIVFSSSLPPASGLSSSSALVIATFLPLAHFNRLDTGDAWRRAISDTLDLAGYLGATENGKAFGPFAADRGVGTHGGSEDQTAILTSRPHHLSQYRFLPVAHEQTVAFPDGWVFGIAMSGVHAAKGAGAQLRYNHLAGEVAALLSLWNRHTADAAVSLLTVLTSRDDAAASLLRWIEAEGAPAQPLVRRLEQFRAECALIPEVVTRIAAGDIAGIGPLVDHSQSLAEAALGNQIDETIHLMRQARAAGAAAASAFGAGFGGSVWALIRRADAAAFLNRWQVDYTSAFPEHASRAEFFTTCPGPGATALGPT